VNPELELPAEPMGGEAACYMHLLDEEGDVEPASRVRLERVYEPEAEETSTRVLVDRIWPRGISKQSLRVDLWAREVAPSDDLRRWYGHRPDRWREFARRYREELRQPDRAASLERLASLAKAGELTLLYAARDRARNHAIVLADVVRARL
jgi:uncharacterized protein YeaO (DUF488 family)